MNNKLVKNGPLSLLVTALFLCINIVNADEAWMCFFIAPDVDFADRLNSLASNAALQSFSTELKLPRYGNSV